MLTTSTRSGGYIDSKTMDLLKQAQLQGYQQGYQQGYNEGRRDYPKLNQIDHFYIAGRKGQALYSLISADDWQEYFTDGPQITVVFWWRMSDDQSKYLGIYSGRESYSLACIYDHYNTLNASSYWSIAFTILSNGDCRVYYKDSSTTNYLTKDIKVDFQDPLRLSINDVPENLQIDIDGVAFLSKPV